jgi:molybdate transport system substrate-binding protein
VSRRPTLIGPIAYVAALVTAAGLVGCGGGTSGAGTSVGTITVLAASSLTDSFNQIGKDFETANPGARVTFSFAGSPTLANQVNQGAPADAFASASPVNLKTVADAGNADGEPVTFARNQLVIAVPKGNPKRVTGLAGLIGPGIKVALCADQVPCGAAAKKAVDAAGITLAPVTLEPDVKSALSKLRLGEVDAALVYRTDVRAAGSDVDGVEFAESAEAINEYPIVVLRDAPNKVGARAFVAYLRSDRAKSVLIAAGFQAP